MKIRMFLILASTVVVGCTSQHRHSETDLSTDAQKASYAMGYDTGLAIKPGITINYADLDAFLLGFNTVMEGREQDLLMSQEEMEDAKNIYQEVVDKKRIEDRENLSLKNSNQGNEFRDKYASKEGVITLDSGVMYREIFKAGNDEHPQISDTVIAHYHGTTVDGSVFDSSVDRGAPVTFPINRVISGWQEILPLMSPGDKWEVVVPPEKAYGENGAGNKIGPNETLVFEIELLEITEE